MPLSWGFVEVIYLIWAYIPDAWLHAVGLTYWPQKYWAIAVPTYACVAFVFAIFIYVAYNFTITPPLDSISTVTDSHSRFEVPGLRSSASIPPICDIPIKDVNHKLYGKQYDAGSS